MYDVGTSYFKRLVMILTDISFDRSVGHGCESYSWLVFKHVVGICHFKVGIFIRRMNYLKEESVSK